MYPVGTKCTITWMFGDNKRRIGDSVTCLSGTYVSQEWPMLWHLPRDMICQQVDVPSEGLCVVHPVTWMLPEDQDTIEDLVEDIVELTNE